MAEPPVARPNRWTGPPSTWRSHTRKEREVANSLHAIRSQDLSIHLYNAFVIKSRVRNANGKGKAKATSEDEIPGMNFIPPDVWTAWPMPEDEVPRDPYLPNVGGKGGFRMDEDVRPSAGLEEALLATITREARERWQARRWEWKESETEVNVKKEGLVDEQISERSGVSDDEEESSGRQMFSSQVFDALAQDESSSNNGQSNGSDDEMDTQPVPLADDDRARKLLLPSIRHIITKADSLLLGLQRAREAYAGNWNKSTGSAIRSGEETDTGRDISAGRSRSSKPTKRARASSVGSSASVASTASRSSKGKGSSKKQLKLRDWSDVLGMAALTGWNPEVIQRAAERCSSLFGEEMLFRKFEEGDRGEKSYFTEQLASGTGLRSSDNENVDEGDGRPEQKIEAERTSFASSPVPSHARRCPISTCPSHNTNFARGAFMYDHVRRHHPDVDINALKKLEAKRRGERRGKHDRSRRRSFSAAAGSDPE